MLGACDQWRQPKPSISNSINDHQREQGDDSEARESHSRQLRAESQITEREWNQQHVKQVVMIYITLLIERRQGQGFERRQVRKALPEHRGPANVIVAVVIED